MLGTEKEQGKADHYRGHHAHRQERKQRYRPHGVCLCIVPNLVKNLKKNLEEKSENTEPD
jgi:hypothetical protein